MREKEALRTLFFFLEYCINTIDGKPRREPGEGGGKHSIFPLGGWG